MPAIAYVADQPAAEVHTSLHRSIVAVNEAQQCAVLWFEEVMRRQLFRGRGYSSMNQYAMQELDFSKSKTDDYVKLAKQLGKLPAVRSAVADGKMGYTKARVIVSVATPETEDQWVKAAEEGTRDDLARKVKKARRAARVDPDQMELLPDTPPVVGRQELPVRFSVDLTPEQEARRSALVERLYKLGGVPADRAELLLEALAALVEMTEAEKCPRSASTSRPPVQIHVHEDAATGRMTVQTSAGKRELGHTDTERMHCDANVCEHGGRNTTTIPPRIRREVLARDQHRCTAPGCGRTHFLEVHHIVSRQSGGSNQPQNLKTLCGSCHRLWHERVGNR